MHMLKLWCSLSMLHRPCENMYKGVRLGGLIMPNGQCTLHMPINNFLEKNNKQQDRCRSQLASMATTTIMEECQNLINMIREFRHLKIRDRQINKFNRLVEKQGKWKGRLANSGNTLPNHQQGRSVGSTHNHHSGMGPFLEN